MDSKTPKMDVVPEKVLRVFTQYLKTVEAGNRVEATAKQKKALKAAVAKLMKLGKDEAEIEGLLLREGLITLKSNCSTCSNCWEPTAKALEACK